MTMDDDLIFLDDGEPGDADAPRQGPPDWKILIVDDEEEIHTVTKMVLNGFIFRDAGLSFISAHSAREARALIREHPDIAVAIVDVVMETDDAGLEFTRFIREELRNETIRIILRTGQPGQAPERQVILSYDINDYKEKSELTAQKLFSAMVTALRSYRDIMAIESSRRGLEKIIEGSASLFRLDSMENFLTGVLMQIGSLLEISVDTLLVSAVHKDGSADRITDGMTVLAASGRFSQTTKGRASDVLEPAIWRKISQVVDSQESVFQEDYSVVYFDSRDDRATAVYVETMSRLQEIDHSLLQLFCANASIGLDNLLRRTSDGARN